MSLHSSPVSTHGQINGFIADKTQTNQSRLARHHQPQSLYYWRVFYSENDWFQDMTEYSWSVITPPLRGDRLIKWLESPHPMTRYKNRDPWCEQESRCEGRAGIDYKYWSHDLQDPWWPLSAHRSPHCSTDELPITHRTTNNMQRSENQEILVHVTKPR